MNIETWRRFLSWLADRKISFARCITRDLLEQFKNSQRRIQ